MNEQPERGRGDWTGVRSRAEAVAARRRGWIDRHGVESRGGVALGTWRRYREVDGPRQSLVLTAYLVLAVLPALLVVTEYLEGKPRALADHLARHYSLSAETTGLLRSVLVHDASHKLGSALLAIAGALFFGLGFGHVLQRVTVRVWRLDLRETAGDQVRFAIVLLGLAGMLVLLLVQTSQIAGHPPWAGVAIAPGWVALLVVYFCWAPRLLVHRRVSARDLLPGAVLTAFGLVLLMLLSSFVMEPWVDFYARDYGGLGVVMATFFWIGFGSTIIVLAASFAPALAERRIARRHAVA